MANDTNLALRVEPDDRARPEFGGETMSDEKLKPGDLVTVRDHGAVRPARIEKHAPYRLPRGAGVCDGYRVQYLDAVEQWHSHNGWQPATALERQGEISNES